MIVLVILGLLVGTVMTGRSLIRASELRAVASDFQNYQTAVLNFRDKYLSLPGDIANATAFFGSSGFPWCPVLHNVPTGTCDGNGDGIYGRWDAPGGWNGAALGGSEPYLAWQHLALAGLISGNFTGFGGYKPTLGGNAPKGKMPNSGYMFGGHTAANNWVYAYYGYEETSVSYLIFFGNPTAASVTITPILSSGEALSIDQKMDDATPSTGKVRTYIRNWPNLIDEHCASTATSYDMSQGDTPTCELLFRLIY